MRPAEQQQWMTGTGAAHRGIMSCRCRWRPWKQPLVLLSQSWNGCGMLVDTQVVRPKRHARKNESWGAGAQLTIQVARIG